MNNISFSKFIVLLLFPLALSYSQSKLTGSVVDSITNEPLIGAWINIEGTNLGASTDVEGKYFIWIHPDTTYKMKVGCLGYETKEYTLTFTPKSSQVLDVVLGYSGRMGCDGLLIIKRKDPN